MPKGEFTNCYAYACDCWDPPNGRNGGALPGAYAGAPVWAEAQESAEDYAARLLDGVVKDVAANGRNCAGYLNVNAALPLGDGFCVAMLSNQVGFHFLRRDSDGRWSWKDGHPEKPAKSVIQVQGVTVSAPMAVNDVRFQDLVGAGASTYIPAWKAMTFRFFVHVPGTTRIKVDGPPR